MLSIKVHAIDISSCASLDQEGATYYLTSDIINFSSVICMDITSVNNVILDCQGHIIDGTIPTGAYGIYVYRDSETATNITIKNCILTDWSNGIYLYYSTNNTIINSTFDFNSDANIYFESSNNNSIINSTISNSNNGIELVNSSYNTIVNSNISFNTYYGIYLSYDSNNTIINSTVNSNYDTGILLEFSGNNTIYNNIIQDNTNYGIYLYYSGSNKIYNNLFNNTNNFIFDRTIYANIWNTTKQLGQRIYSSGIYIGGNYWANPTGDGYSDTCTDSDTDGFCDESYTLADDNIDYLPLSSLFIIPEEPEKEKYDPMTSAVLSIIPFAISIGMISLVLRRSLAEFNVEYIVGLSIIILITIALLIAIIEAI